VAKDCAPWWRKKKASKSLGAFAALPCPPSELPSSLNTRRWRPSDPDWEDRPRDPADPNAKVQFRPPVGIGFDPSDVVPLAVEEE
jgi:hypothetical protein